jgi:dienelactone hydrolase
MISIPTTIRLAMLLVSVFPAAACMAGPPLWGQLEEGAYDVGFTTVEAYDYSRSFLPKYDYFGNPLLGERARPVQACIWYPAIVDSSELSMTFGEYLFPNPADPEFFGHVSRLQNRYNRELIAIMNGDQGAALDGLNMPMAAVRDAEAVGGSFPLVIYHNDMGPYFDNVVLCEYLASHGYAVAAVPSTGVSSYNVAAEAPNLEYLTRDNEFALTLLREIDFIDTDRIAVVGLGAGALTALVQSVRSTEIQAAACYDGWNLIKDRRDLAEQLVFYQPRELALPVFFVNLDDPERYLAETIDSMKYADRYVLTVDTSDPSAVGSNHVLAAYMFDTTGGSESPVSAEYKDLCRTTLAFLNKVMQGDSTADDILAASPRYPAMKLPPTPGQFVQIIQEQGAEAAADLYDEFQESDPGAVTAPEQTLNLLGYQVMRRGDAANAVRLFRINAELHPASSNVWDSYADGCLAIGDTAQAIRCYERVLKTLPEYDDSGSGLKETLRNNAEEGLARLRGESTETPDQGDTQ